MSRRDAETTKVVHLDKNPVNQVSEHKQSSNKTTSKTSIADNTKTTQKKTSTNINTNATEKTTLSATTKKEITVNNTNNTNNINSKSLNIVNNSQTKDPINNIVNNITKNSNKNSNKSASLSTILTNPSASLAAFEAAKESLKKSSKSIAKTKRSTLTTTKSTASKKTIVKESTGKESTPESTSKASSTRKRSKQMPGQKIELSCSKEADEVYCTFDFDSDELFTNSTRKSSPSSSVGRLSPTPLLHFDPSSCCRKCKCCIRPFAQNNRSQEIAFRLKEKSKRRMEMEVKNENDHLNEYMHSRCRSQSNDSDVTCTYEDGCKCKECIMRAKIRDELIAEEESNKKKKMKKKKKKAKKHDASINDDDDDEEYDRNISEMNALKDMEEEEFNYNPPVMFNEGNSHYKIANPIETSMEQWIPVKTKTNKQECNSSKLNNKSCPTTLNNNSNVPCDKSETNFMSEQKKKSSIDGLAKELSHLGFGDATKMNSKDANIANSNNNQCSLTNAQKARLIAIDADLADKRDELEFAIELITEAIQLDHKNPILYINRSYYYERMTNYQRALEDAEKAIELEEKLSVDDYREYSLFRRYKAHEGLENFEAAETDLNAFMKSLEAKSKNDVQAFKEILPRIQKNLLILRLKKLVHRGYSLPLARLYASKFGTIREALEKIKGNSRTLKQKSDSLALHLQIFNLQCQKYDKNVCCYNEDGDVLSDEEIYLSDDEEFDMLYSKDRFSNAKDILVRNNPNQYYTDDYHEQLNSKGQKALWIGNVAPNCDATLASGMFSKFGNVTFCRNFTNENPVDHSSDVGYLLLHYDNDISPKLVMAYFREEVIPGLSKDGCYALLIRFRNKNEKEEEEESQSSGGPNSSSTTVSTPAPKEYQNVKAFPNSNNKQQANSECYYWRTTGCDRERCLFKHIPANKGVDRQHWMRRKH